MFFKRNTSITDDTEQVLYAASVLNVSEFRLFELAYEDWFGEPAREAFLEAVYMPYVVCGTTPVWVRSYARKTQQWCEDAGMYLPQSASVSLVHPMLSPLRSTENWIIGTGFLLILLLLG